MIFPGSLRYIEYLLFARHRKGHGIHSPFVFDFVNRILRNKTVHPFVLTIEKLREKNIRDLRIINVVDLGAGSRRFKTSSRKVSEIAKYSAIPGKYGILLSNMAAEYGKSSIIEFGTSLGISTMYLAAGSPGSVVYTMEGCPQTSRIAAENFREGGFDNIVLMTGSFDDLLPQLKRKRVKPGLVFIDGNHKKEPLCRYFSGIYEISDNDTVIIIDDIHYSNEMEKAWNEIRSYENVSVTIDLFRMGLVFFRKGVTRSGYTLRY